MPLPAGVAEGVICFDLETQKSFEEVGGRQNIEQLRMSVGIVLAPATGEYTMYRENEVFALADRLFGAPLVVGFNTIAFDYPVVGAYVKRDWKQVKTMDLMVEVVKGVGHRVSLAALSEGTLGAGKLADGLQAIKWFRENNWTDLIRYCKEDVRLTWELYAAARRDGFLWYSKSGKKEQFATPGV